LITKIVVVNNSNQFRDKFTRVTNLETTLKTILVINNF